MERTLKFQLEITIDVPEDYTMEDTLEEVREMMVEDGLAEYINEDNLINE